MFGSLIKTILLVVNAIAILNDKRFIKKCTTVLSLDFGGEVAANTMVPGEAPSGKGQLIMLILTLRTYGICTHSRYGRPADTLEHHNNPAGAVQLSNDTYVITLLFKNSAVIICCNHSRP